MAKEQIIDNDITTYPIMELHRSSTYSIYSSNKRTFEQIYKVYNKKVVQEKGHYLQIFEIYNTTEQKNGSNYEYKLDASLMRIT